MPVLTFEFCMDLTDLQNFKQTWKLYDLRVVSRTLSWQYSGKRMKHLFIKINIHS